MVRKYFGLHICDKHYVWAEGYRRKKDDSAVAMPESSLLEVNQANISLVVLVLPF